jgi:hypothetical protein
MVAAAVIGSAVIGGGVAMSASSKAAKAQTKASQDATAAQERMFERQTELQEPFRQGGLTAQQEIMQLLGIGGDKTAAGYGSMGKAFGASDFQQDPGYAFRQAEGMKALERAAAARGNLLSGSAMKGIQRFGQDLASQEYQNAFNRYQVERSAKLNPLQSLMGSGQSAANVLTGAAGQMGQNEASNIYNAGQARASGYIGQANALNQALGGITNYMVQAPVNKAAIDYYSRTPAVGGGSSGGLPSTGGAGMQYNPFAPNPYATI